jgi:hypothetical protein
MFDGGMVPTTQLLSGDSHEDSTAIVIKHDLGMLFLQSI